MEEGRVIKGLWAKHKEALRRIEAGERSEEIAQAVSLSAAAVRVLRSGRYVEERSEVRAESLAASEA